MASEIPLLTAAELQNRYVQLANALAVLSAEAAALEVGMSDGKFFPMSLQVYNNVKSAHQACLLCLHTLGYDTGVPVEVVDNLDPIDQVIAAVLAPPIPHEPCPCIEPGCEDDPCRWACPVCACHEPCGCK